MTEEQITRLYGPRCAEHCDDCCVCEVWAMHDHIEKLEADKALLREALGEIWEWIGNWSPDFIWDDEWPATEAKARAALQETIHDRD